MVTILICAIIGLFFCLDFGNDKQKKKPWKPKKKNSFWVGNAPMGYVD